MDELRVKLSEIVTLYEGKIVKIQEEHEDQWKWNAVQTYSSIITGLNIAIEWLDEFNDGAPSS